MRASSPILAACATDGMDRDAFLTEPPILPPPLPRKRRGQQLVVAAHWHWHWPAGVVAKCLTGPALPSNPVIRSLAATTPLAAVPWTRVLKPNREEPPDPKTRTAQARQALNLLRRMKGRRTARQVQPNPRPKEATFLLRHSRPPTTRPKTRLVGPGSQSAALKPPTPNE